MITRALRCRPRVRCLNCGHLGLWHKVLSLPPRTDSWCRYCQRLGKGKACHEFPEVEVMEVVIDFEDREGVPQ